MHAFESPGAPQPVAASTCQERTIYAWPLIRIGSFDCWPGDERWRRTNHVAEGHVIAFPGRAVEISQEGDRPRSTDALRLVFYNRNQAYRRRLVSPDGDHCTYLVVAPQVLDEAIRESGNRRADAEARPFITSVAPSGRRDHLEMQLILRSLRAGADELAVQERLLRLVMRVMRSVEGRPPMAAPARRRATRAAREQLVEGAREIAARELEGALKLEQVARELSVSVFHLSRVFREETGIGLHAFRDQLRLRSGLPSVLDDSTRLTDVAMSLGYATPSHFTDRFRAAYGVAPSRLRDRGHGGVRGAPGVGVPAR